jgi:exodeoxyribonuclease VII small subunit
MSKAAKVSVPNSPEADDLPLETLLTRFEEGTKLAQFCQTKLAEAEVKIQQLEKSSAGSMTLQPLALEESNAL